MNKVTPLVVVPGRECMSAGEAQRSPGVAVPPRRLRRRPLLCLAPGRGGRPLIERRPGRERLLPSPSGVPRPGRREGDGGRAASSGRAFFPAAARAGGRGPRFRRCSPGLPPLRAKGARAPSGCERRRCPPVPCFSRPQRWALSAPRAGAGRLVACVPRRGCPGGAAWGEAALPRAGPGAWGCRPGEASERRIPSFNLSIAGSRSPKQGCGRWPAPPELRGRGAAGGYGVSLQGWP